LTDAAGYRLVGWLELAWTRLSQRLKRAVFDEMTVEFVRNSWFGLGE